MNKVVIVGCGNVGMAYAYALVNQKTYVSDLVLIDINVDKTIGEVMDLNHCLPYSPSKMNIRVGNYQECKDAKIVVITAGANQKIGETRMDLIYKNADIFKSIITEIKKSGFDGIYLIATNPLDVMTYLTLKYSGSSYEKVIGTGAALDTARLRYLLGEELNICPKDIDAYVIGEHGDTEFIPWSNANVGFKKITDYLKEDKLNEIEDKVRNSAYEVIERKGATCYGIGTCMVRITNAILEDKKVILAVSSYDKKNDVCISTPTTVGSMGVSRKIYIPLSKEEEEKLQNSVDYIKEAINKLKERDNKI
jgi:L-lactate dehydrogenase